MKDLSILLTRRGLGQDATSTMQQECWPLHDAVTVATCYQCRHLIHDVKNDVIQKTGNTLQCCWRRTEPQATCIELKNLVKLCGS